MMYSFIRLLIRLNGRTSIDPQHIVFGLGIVLTGFVILQCLKTAYELRKS